MKGPIALFSLLLYAGGIVSVASAGVTYDDFNSTTLNSGWTWSDPDNDDTHSLSDRAGYLRIKLASGSEDSWTGSTWATARNSAPFLLTTTANYPTNFVVETKVDAATVNGGVMPNKFVAGIVLYDTANETTTFSGTYHGYDMGFGLLRDDNQTDLGRTTIVAQACDGNTHGAGTLDLTKAYYLRMVRDSAAATWTCSYRQDGKDTWTQVAAVNDWELPGYGIGGTAEIGFYAKTWIGGTATPGADLDYFSVTAVPEPGTFALVATGLMGLLAYAWRKRR